MTRSYSMIRQKVLPRVIPPCPPNFADNFVKGGWRLVERLYGARTDTLIKWMDMCGREDLEARRRERLTAVSSQDTRR